MQNESVRLSLKLREKFAFWLETSSSHGLPNIARTEKWILRIIWTLCFLTSLAYCLSVIITSFIDFLKYETNVSISKINELPTVFPAITFCNVNPFNEYRARDYLDSLRKELDSKNCVFSDTIPVNCSDWELLVDVFIDKLKRVIANDKSMHETVKDEYGFQQEEILWSSFYNGVANDNDKYYKTWSHEYGNCFTFNSGKMPNQTILKTSSTGSKYGFMAEILLKSPYVDNLYEYQQGLYLIVHNQTRLPFTLDTGIFIPPGVQAFIGVNRVFTNKLDGLYSNCINNLESENPYAQKLFGYFKDLGVTNYDQKFCFTMCSQDKLVDACNCTNINTPTIRNARYCSNDDELDCMFNFLANYSNSDLNILCEVCVEECVSIEYQLEVSTSSYPTSAYAKSLAKYYDHDEYSDLIDSFEETTMKINIYYNNLYYTLIQEKPKTQVTDLLGNLGGQLGLFIGISFLSLVEIFELFIDLAIICIEHRKTKKITPVEEIKIN